MRDVSQMKLTKGSVMPKDFAKRLGGPDIDNIVAYLSRQSTRPIEEPKGKVK